MYNTNPDFGAYFIVWQNDAFQHADAAFCNQIKAQYGLTMPVLVWANPMEADAVGLDERHIHMVMEEGAKIRHRAQFNDSSFRPVIDQILAEP